MKTHDTRFTFIVEKTCTFTQKRLDHLLIMTSYLVTIETDHHSTWLKMRARDERTATVLGENSEISWGVAFPPLRPRVKLCEYFLVESPNLYLTFIKTILTGVFRTFGLPLRFLSSNSPFICPWSFYHPTIGFSSFLAVSTTDKPVNWSIHANALTQLNVFAVRGFIFRDIHKNQGRSSSNSGY